MGGCECICKDICGCVHEHIRVTFLWVNEVCVLNKKEYVPCVSSQGRGDLQGVC